MALLKHELFFFQKYDPNTTTITSPTASNQKLIGKYQPACRFGGHMTSNLEYRGRFALPLHVRSFCQMAHVMYAS